jgi:hypothetical protein
VIENASLRHESEMTWIRIPSQLFLKLLKIFGIFLIEMKWNETKRNEMKSIKNSWNEIKWNQMKSNEIKWNQMKWNEMRLWIKMNCNLFFGINCVHQFSYFPDSLHSLNLLDSLSSVDFCLSIIKLDLSREWMRFLNYFQSIINK